MEPAAVYWLVLTVRVRVVVSVMRKVKMLSRRSISPHICFSARERLGIGGGIGGEWIMVYDGLGEREAEVRIIVREVKREFKAEMVCW